MNVSASQAWKRLGDQPRRWTSMWSRPGTQQPDDVCGSGWVEAFPQTSFPHEIGDDVGGPLTVLSEMRLP